MSAPHVAGIAALMLEAKQELTATEIEETLKATAIPAPSQVDVPSFDWGHGRVNAQGAIQAVTDLHFVNDTLTTYGRYLNPEISVDSLGNSVIVWADDADLNRNYVTKWNVFDPAGNQVYPFDLFLSSEEVNEIPFGTEPHVAHAPNGGYAMVWEGHREFGDRTDIQAVVFREGGAFDRYIDVNVNVSGVQVRPRVAFLDNNTLLFVWANHSETEGLFLQPSMRIIHLDRSYSPPEIVFTPLKVSSLDVAVNDAGDAVIAYAANTTGQYLGKVIHARYRPRGEEVFSPSTLISHPEEEYFESVERPRVSINDSGVYSVTWFGDTTTATTPGIQSVHLAVRDMLNNNAELYRVNRQEDRDAWYPDAQILNSGEVVSVRRSTRGSDNNLLKIRRHDAAGGIIGMDGYVHRAGYAQTAPSIAVTDSGRAAIVWEHHTFNQGRNIALTFLD